MKRLSLLLVLTIISAVFLTIACDDEADKSYLNPFTPDPNDIDPPTVSIVSPADSSVVPRDDSVLITINASDDTGIRRIYLSINDVLVYDQVDAPYEYYWDTRTLSPGVGYKLCAYAHDNGGKVTETCNTAIIELK
ncbi:MAG: Ig-like domain-containing protein [Candidatus Zixiibacteriota bacterium]